MLEPLSEDAADALETMIRWQGNHDFVTMELPAHDDLVIEANREMHPANPFGDADAHVDVSLTHKQNGDVMRQPKIGFVGIEGDWFPIHYRSDGVMRSRFSPAETDGDGNVVLNDSASFQTGVGSEEYSGAREAYDDLLEYANEWLPTIHAKYQNGEPVE